jgi:hypothetical protein
LPVNPGDVVGVLEVGVLLRDLERSGSTIATVIVFVMGAKVTFVSILVCVLAVFLREKGVSIYPPKTKIEKSIFCFSLCVDFISGSP